MSSFKVLLSFTCYFFVLAFFSLFLVVFHNFSDDVVLITTCTEVCHALTVKGLNGSDFVSGCLMFSVKLKTSLTKSLLETIKSELVWPRTR